MNSYRSVGFGTTSPKPPTPKTLPGVGASRFQGLAGFPRRLYGVRDPDNTVTCIIFLLRILCCSSSYVY